jgi:small conductance mechanosensitive channel
MITAGGVTGDVREIGLLVTAVDTVDNIRVYVGNNKLFSDSIQNYSTNAYRRVDLKAQVAHSVNPYDAIKRLSERVAQIPNIVANPAPSVEVLDFNAMGTVIAVRPFCHNNHYWQVYFDTNKAIVDVCSAANYAVPETRHAFRQTPA